MDSVQLAHLLRRTEYVARPNRMTFVAGMFGLNTNGLSLSTVTRNAMVNFVTASRTQESAGRLVGEHQPAHDDHDDPRIPRGLKDDDQCSTQISPPPTPFAC